MEKELKKRKTSPFRPAYGEHMQSLIERDITVIALTATEDTRNIIMQDLCMVHCEKIIINPNKPNVKYSVEVTKEKDVCTNFKWLLDLLIAGVKCPRISFLSAN